MPRTIEVGDNKLIYHDDGILQFYYPPGCKITLTMARNLFDAADEAGDPTVQYPVLVLLDQVKKVDRDARALFSSQESKEAFSAVALVAGNPVSRILANFFLGLNRVPLPTKLFGTPDEARAWLVQFV